LLGGDKEILIEFLRGKREGGRGGGKNELVVEGKVGACHAKAAMSWQKKQQGENKDNAHLASRQPGRMGNGV